MDFRITDEQQLLLESLRELVERGNYDQYFKDCDKAGEFPSKAADAAVEAGFGQHAPVPQKNADGLSGPVFVPEPAHDGRGHHRRAARCAQAVFQ